MNNFPIDTTHIHKSLHTSHEIRSKIFIQIEFKLEDEY